MTNTSRLTKIGLLFLGVLVLAATSWAQTRAPIAEQIAKAYGVDSWDKVEAVRYTWNASFPGGSVAHAWVWEPKTGQVSYEGKDMDGKPVKVTYNSNQLSSQRANVKDVIEPSFINDQYWAFFPFHVAWDGSATVTDDGLQKLPLGAGSARRVTVKYPAEAGGYTPGDTWTLYVGKDNRVLQFVYLRGGDKKPNKVTARWIAYKKAGPLLFATDHPGTADGKPLRIFFADVAVKLTGSDAWIDAK